MSPANLLAAITLTMVCGCVSSDEKRFTKGQGDVMQFIAQQAITHGARSVATNNLQQITDRWRYFQDTNGVVVRLHRDRFPEIYAALQQTFGPPDREPIETTDRGKIGWYAAKTLGVGIQFSSNRRNSQVIVIRPQKDWHEVLKRSAEVHAH